MGEVSQKCSKEIPEMSLSGVSHCGELYELCLGILYHLLLEIATPIPHIFKPVSPAPLTEHAETGIILVLSPIRYSQSGEVVRQ